MAKIYNSDLTKELVNGGKIQINVDKVPNEIAEKVVPVMEVNPRLLRKCRIVRSATATNPASATIIYTTPGDQDFYLTGAMIHAFKNVISDLGTGNFCSLQVVINGATQRLMSFNGLTLTLQEQNATMNFDPPILIDRNSVINVAAQSAPAAGTYIRSANIVGYIDEVSNA